MIGTFGGSNYEVPNREGYNKEVAVYLLNRLVPLQAQLGFTGAPINIILFYRKLAISLSLGQNGMPTDDNDMTLPEPFMTIYIVFLGDNSQPG